MIPRLLICEPDASLSLEIQNAAAEQHLWIVTCHTIEEAQDLLQKQAFHVCVWPVESEEEVTTLFELKQKRSELAVIVSSRSHSPDFIVHCMRAGAGDFWHRAQGVQHVSQLIGKALSRNLPIARSNEREGAEFAELSGRHPKIQEVFSIVSRIKDTESNVLITGESGTGKELVARAIHTLSRRAKMPWVAVNCSAIPANLLESELFGHVKGAFTGATQNRIGRFQMAGNGTLFLDEIGELSLDLQAKLLRAIQTKEFEPVGSTQSVSLRARVIAATNQNLESAVSEKRFREDLFYRLNVIPVFMPPLRTRKTDIPLLVQKFLQKYNTQNEKGVRGISEDAMRCLMQYHWPGNIRELENLIERVVVLKEDNTIIEINDFPVGYFRQVKLDRFVANVAFPEDGLNFNEAVNEFENELILQALRCTEGNKNKAATLLKLNRTTLVEKLKRKGLRVGN